ncbi:MAG: DMT family transporter [Alphaproteobacteria bacterium]
MSDTPSQNRLTAAWARLPGNLRGVLWITMGTLAFALNDVFIKLTGKTFHPFELAVFRYGIGVVLLSPVFLHMGVAGLKTKRFGLHMARLVMACLAQLGVFVAVINLHLADATAIAFSRPLFTTVIAVIVLHEIVHWRRWTATCIGFAGVLVMVRPGHDGVDLIALIAVASALTFAVANILIRMLSRTEPPNRILFYYHVGGTLVFAVPAMFVWVTPVGMEWAMLLMIGVMTTIGMIGFVRAFSVGEANAVGPLEYARLIYAALLGFFMFGEVPDIWTMAGAALIVVSTLYIARVEARRG